jgi:hypothetical protein
MSQPTEFTIGSEVSCRDGACGELRRVVIDPVARALTHLVVEPKHGSAKGHLVPVDLVASASGRITLTCTTSEFDKLDEAEETEFLPGGDGRFGYGQDQVISWPYFGMGGGLVAAGGLGGAAYAGTTGNRGPSGHMVTNVVVRGGEVLVRRGEPVHATDGAIGKVKGLVIHPATTASHTSCSTRATCGAKRGSPSR